MLQDLYMLIKWNPQNTITVLQIVKFQHFLLDALYKYQISLFDTELKGIPMAIWELGTKTYTLLLKYALLNENQGWKHLHNLFTWVENKRILLENEPNSAQVNILLYF